MSRSNPLTPVVLERLRDVLQPGDRILDYDRANEEELHRLYDVVVTDQALNETSLTEIEGLLDRQGVLCILGVQTPPAGLSEHFKRCGRRRGMVVAQHPRNPEEARIRSAADRTG